MQIAIRIKNILSSPASEWNEIRKENRSIMDLFLNYALILGLIPPVSGLIGYLIFGIYLKKTAFKVHPGSLILWSVFSYILNLITVLICGYIIDAFSRTFHTQRNLNSSMKVIIFSFTPVWITGIFYLIPSINFLTTIGWIYAMILMYFGLKLVKAVPGERIIGYELLVYCVMVVIYYFTNLIITGLAFGSVIGKG